MSAVAAMPGPREERTLAARSRAWPCLTFLPDRMQLEAPPFETTPEHARNRSWRARDAVCCPKRIYGVSRGL